VNGHLFIVRRNPLIIASLVALGFHVLQIQARADWLHYRGPTMNGISPEKGWNAQFPAEGPKVLWRANLGIGTSSITVAGDRGFSMGNLDGKDIVYCFDVKNRARRLAPRLPAGP
jgi:hypothetical protein